MRVCVFVYVREIRFKCMLYLLLNWLLVLVICVCGRGGHTVEDCIGIGQLAVVAKGKIRELCTFYRSLIATEL